MPISSVLKDLREYPHAPGGRVRLATIVRLRWVTILGQLVAIGFGSLILGFDVPLAYTLSLIALSAWINVFLAIQHPGRHRLPTHWAAALLVYDILQLSGLLYLTGGIGNPFVILLLAPVTVSAATLPPIHTVVIGATALVSAYLLTYFYWPLPWYEGMRQEFRAGRFEPGLLQAIDAVEARMLQHWALTEGQANQNELPDKPFVG